MYVLGGWQALKVGRVGRGHIQRSFAYHGKGWDFIPWKPLEDFKPRGDIAGFLIK